MGSYDPNTDPSLTDPTVPPADPSVTPPATTPGATPTTSSSGNPFGIDANTLRLIQAALGIYGATQSSSFHQAPDPLTDALRARIYGFIDNSPSRNIFGTALNDYIKQGANTPMPMVPDKYGYNPYPNGAPKYDLSNIMPMIQAGISPQTTGAGPSTSAPGPATTSNPFQGTTNPTTGAPSDPYGDFPTTPGGPDPGSVTGWMAAHPNIVSGGEMAVGAGLSMAFGLPGAIAARMASWAINWYTKNHPADPNAPQTLPPGNLQIPPGALTPGGGTQQINIDPATGNWSNGGNGSQLTQGQIDAINGQNSNLMTGPGDPGYGQFGGGFGGTDPSGNPYGPHY